MEPDAPKLRELRNHTNLTQRDVAYLLGVTEKTVQRWEAGSALPHPRHRRMLAKRFGVTESELGFPSA